ncbi:hypothetical protein E2C01_054200 [Portunus trituberculatus]|uniref:Uncharacterized protein n=1 Tax=Portunus trituberculatus TaxID=210409 RepID=A0A5B7GMM4_PORTR|nr:hypothetical protein [Portunus trituberculatus]
MRVSRCFTGPCWWRISSHLREELQTTNKICKNSLGRSLSSAILSGFQFIPPPAARRLLSAGPSPARHAAGSPQRQT